MKKLAYALATISMLVAVPFSATFSAQGSAGRFPALANQAPQIFQVQQQQNICACYTYANSVCSGPCDYSGRPQGCFCRQF